MTARRQRRLTWRPRKVKTTVEFIVWHAIWWFLLYSGFIDGIEGAKNVVRFFLWAVLVPMGIWALTDHCAKVMAEQNNLIPATARAIRQASQVASIAVFAWTGHMFTAAALLFVAVSGLVHADMVRKLRDDASKAKAMTRTSGQVPPVRMPPSPPPAGWVPPSDQQPPPNAP